MGILNFDPTQQFVSPIMPDGRPDSSQLNPQQSVYNPNSPDIARAEQWALEGLRIAGAWVTVLPRSEDGKYDAVWMEDPDPTYYAGVDFKAWFQPTPPEILLTKFGIDAPTQLELRFSRAEVYRAMGDRLIRHGDVIIVPHNSLVIRAERFVVVSVSESGNYRYRFLYLDVTVENINKDESFEPRAI